MIISSTGWAGTVDLEPDLVSPGWREWMKEGMQVSFFKLLFNHHRGQGHTRVQGTS